MAEPLPPAGGAAFAATPLLPARPALWLVLGEWRAQPLRVAAAVFAIAVGVALGFAVHLVNQAALASFAGAVHSVAGSADLQVEARTPAGFAESLYPQIARLPGVAVASPVVEVAATSGQLRRPGSGGTASGRLTLTGLDPFRAAAVTPALVGVRPGRNGAALDGVYFSAAALAATGAHVGGPVTLAAGGRLWRTRVAGRLAGVGRAVAVTDIATAQWRLGQLGRLQRLDVRLAQGADPAEVAARLRALLPADADVATPAGEEARSDSLSRAYRVNLGMLAMVALLTGGFLVFSVQSLAVARRRPQFALLRVLGLRQGALARLVVGEGLALGIAGSGLGLGLGFVLAAAAIDLVGGDLGGGYFGGARPVLAVTPLAGLVFAGLGIGVAVVASLLPGREAARARPAVALKSGADGDFAPPRAWPGLALLAAGGLAALAPPIAGLPLAGYAAMALLLAGGVAVMPALARALLAPWQALRAPVPVELALRRLWGAPRGAAVALCGIVASTGLMVAMAVMVASFRGSVDDWLGQVLPSDVYLHLEGVETGGLDRAAQARLAATPGVARIRFQRAIAIRLAADRPEVQLSAQPVGPEGPVQLPRVGATAMPPPGEVPVWVSEAMVWLYDARPGTRLRLPLGGRTVPVFVAGVWRDYARQFGAIAMADDDFTRLTGDATRSDAAVDVAPGADPRRIAAALTARLPPALAGQALVARPAEMRAVALRMFDRSFAITYALEIVSILIGLVGVAATFSGQTLARAREFGMLRHIGVTRGQVLAMLASEGALLGIVGGIAGISLGLVMAQVLIHVVNPQSFHWTMDVSLPWGLLAGLFAALVAAAAGTAVVAGRRALSADAVRAVRDDW